MTFIFVAALFEGGVYLKNYGNSEKMNTKKSKKYGKLSKHAKNLRDQGSDNRGGGENMCPVWLPVIRY